jgi:ribonuclease G
MRDGVDDDTTRILIDDAEAVAQARAYAARTMPDAIDKIQLFNGPGELFDQSRRCSARACACRPAAGSPSKRRKR